MRFGSSQMRMAYWPAPKTDDVADARGGASSSFATLIDGVVRQEQAVEAAVGRRQRRRTRGSPSTSSSSYALDLHLCGQRRERRRDPVLHQDLRLSGSVPIAKVTVSL